MAEVVARFGDRVVDVAHLGARKRKRTAHVLLGAGALAMLGGIGLFAYETAQPWDAWSEASLEAQARGAQAPGKPGLGTGALGLGLALFGLVPFVAGGLRMRDDFEQSYAIGEAPGARITVSGVGLPTPDSFDLVRREGDAVVLRFAPQMRGYVDVGGRRHALADLSARDEGSQRAYALPHGAKAQIEHGGMSFWVRAVDPAKLALARAPIDKPYWAATGGVGAAAAALITMMSMMPEDGLSFAWEDEVQQARYARYLLQMDEQRDEPTQSTEPEAGPSDGGGEPGQRHAGDEGKAGKPGAKSPRGKMSLKRKPGHPPQLARNQNPEQLASEAGILGIMQQQSGGMIASPFGGAFQAGDADENVWGQLTGEYVAEAGGNGAMGLVGTGRAGGGSAKGLVGLGNTGLIGSKKGDPRGRLGSAPFGGRGPRKAPPPRHGVEKTTGGMDKSVIRRVVRSHINEVRACYNQALTRNPNAAGKVEVAFIISTTGKVTTSTVTQNALRDVAAGKCVAKAVKRWRFPRPLGGSAVTVHYPFVFRAG